MPPFNLSVVVPKAEALPTASVPADSIVEPPAYVLVPERVSVPVLLSVIPALVAPVIMPPIVTLPLPPSVRVVVPRATDVAALNVVRAVLLTVRVELADSVIRPLKVRAPVPPIVLLAASVVAFARVYGAVVELWIVPPFSLSVPVPKALLLPTSNRPAIVVMVPV